MFVRVTSSKPGLGKRCIKSGMYQDLLRNLKKCENLRIPKYTENLKRSSQVTFVCRKRNKKSLLKNENRVNGRSFFHRSAGVDVSKIKPSMWNKFREKNDQSAKINKIVKNYNIDPNHIIAMDMSYTAGYADKSYALLRYSVLFLFGISIGGFLYVKYGKVIFKNKEEASQSNLVEIPNISFNDVRGIDEVKEELELVVDFLKNPFRYWMLGAKLPRGILLVGDPGSGKTLLAKAIAGEAGVPFYYISGAEFDEKYVGVGSKRVRSLFKAARQNSPCIIFIDEIDAVGNKRSNTESHPYARQTINQLLQEMDGFNESAGVIVLGATNTIDVIDNALRRPGRFDTEIHVLKPDLKGRKEILQLYIDKTVHENDIDLDNLGRLTEGMTGAGLANLVNQAALNAAQQYQFKITLCDLEYALDKIRMGIETKGHSQNEEEKRKIAFHEAGHALAAFYNKNSDPIFKATIAQRRGSLGHVSYIPKSENLLTKKEIIARINIAMAGRVAEEIIFGKDFITTGASSDFQNATIAAEQMILAFGMGKMGYKVHSHSKMSESAKREMELEVQALLDSSYKNMKKLLTSKTEEHRLLAEALIKYETLTQEEIKLLIQSKDINSIGIQREEKAIQQWS